MSIVKRVEKKPEYQFVGKAWVNVIDRESSKNVGKEYINIQLDRDIAEVTLKQGGRLLLWPNNKREGKQDADYRLSIQASQNNA